MPRTTAAEYNARIEGQNDGQRFANIGILPEPRIRIGSVLKQDGLEDSTVIEKGVVAIAYSTGFIEGVVGSSDPPDFKKKVHVRVRF